MDLEIIKRNRNIHLTTEELLVDKAQLLTLTVPEMAVLVRRNESFRCELSITSNNGVFTTSNPGAFSRMISL